VADRVEQRLVVRVREESAARTASPGPPVHDDLCAVIDEHGRTRHVFTADAPNQLWLTDITEHKTAWMRMSTSAGPRAAI
jgi:transposase InsO family protein